MYNVQDYSVLYNITLFALIISLRGEVWALKLVQPCHNWLYHIRKVNGHVFVQSANLGWVRFASSILRLRLTSYVHRHLSVYTSAVIRYLICVYASHFFAGWPYHFNQILCTANKFKMATIDECIEYALKNICLWWRYGISRHWDEWKYIIIGRIFESEIILIPPSLKISESSSNGSYRNTDQS